MARRTQTYAIRLAVEGGGQVKAELVSVGQSGEQSLKRIETAGDRASGGLQGRRPPGGAAAHRHPCASEVRSRGSQPAAGSRRRGGAERANWKHGRRSAEAIAQRKEAATIRREIRQSGRTDAWPLVARRICLLTGYELKY